MEFQDFNLSDDLSIGFVNVLSDEANQASLSTYIWSALSAKLNDSYVAKTVAAPTFAKASKTAK